MLPDIPKLKAELAKKFYEFFCQRVNAYLGVFSESPRSYVKEGHSVFIIRPDGERDETEITKTSVETSTTFEEVPFVTIKDRLVKLDALAREMAGKISKQAYETLNKAVDKAGNSVSAEGKPLSPELYLTMMEKIQLAFDKDGNPNNLSILIPPQMEQRAKEVFTLLNTDEGYRKQYQEIISIKRMEWRDREAARRLVG